MYDIFEFDFGRNALKYLVQKYGINRMYIPYYLCDVIRHSLVEEKCKPIFYHIDDNFYPVLDFPENEYILYPNYFGICNNNVQKLAKNYSKLILDNAHAYFNEPLGFACFNAGHKFGIKKSKLWIKNNNNKNKIQHSLDEEALMRKHKFLKLHEKYYSNNTLRFDIENLIAPYVYPYLASSTDDADLLVKSLKEDGKTIYRYWNSLPRSFNEYKFYSKLVPIPLD